MRMLHVTQYDFEDVLLTPLTWALQCCFTLRQIVHSELKALLRTFSLMLQGSVVAGKVSTQLINQITQYFLLHHCQFQATVK